MASVHTLVSPFLPTSLLLSTVFLFPSLYYQYMRTGPIPTESTSTELAARPSLHGIELQAATMTASAVLAKVSFANARCWRY